MTRARAKGPGTPLRGGLLVQNPAWNGWLRLRDTVLRMLVRPAAAPAAAPQRVLLCVGGHIGDAVIATGSLRELTRALPGVEVGVLCATWNRHVLDGHPRVARVHVADHWRLNRRGGRLGRLVQWWRTSRAARRELRAAEYDVAVDLSPYYPNWSWLLWRAGVPRRVGFSSGGGGPLYTSAVQWRQGRHVVEEHQDLLRLVAPTVARPRGYDLALPTAAECDDRLRALGLPPEGYVVIHMGAGHPRKEWPLRNWQTLVQALAARGITAVLTGSGPAQARLGREVACAAPTALNVCDALGWTEFCAVLARARVVISVDTVAGHLAAAAGTPAVILMTGMDVPSRWMPLAAPGGVEQLTAPVPCAPCYLSRGCASMSCIRDVTVESVLAAAGRHLPDGAGQAGMPVGTSGTSAVS